MAIVKAGYWLILRYYMTLVPLENTRMTTSEQANFSFLFFSRSFCRDFILFQSSILFSRP